MQRHQVICDYCGVGWATMVEDQTIPLEGATLAS